MEHKLEYIIDRIISDYNKVTLDEINESAKSAIRQLSNSFKEELDVSSPLPLTFKLKLKETKVTLNTIRKIENDVTYIYQLLNDIASCSNTKK